MRVRSVMEWMLGIVLAMAASALLAGTLMIGRFRPPDREDDE